MGAEKCITIVHVVRVREVRGPHSHSQTCPTYCVVPRISSRDDNIKHAEAPVYKIIYMRRRLGKYARCVLLIGLPIESVCTRDCACHPRLALV